MILVGLLIGLAVFATSFVTVVSKGTRKRIQALTSQELFQRKHQYRLLWILMIIIAVVGPLPIAWTISLASDRQTADLLEAVLLAISLSGASLFMTFLRLQTIVSAEIEFRESTTAD